MRNVRLIQSLRDENYRPTRRTIADGLDRLKQELGAEPKTGRCHLHVSHWPSGAASFAAIWFQADEGDDIIITYPFSKGCWALTTSGARIHLSLDQLDGALVDDHGNVRLGDDRYVRALEFDVLPHPKDFSDLEHAIVFLTVRFLEAEDIAFRCVPEAEYWFIDYGKLSELSVRNVKELARYINAHIGRLAHRAGDTPLGPVSLGKIQSTLAMAGIRKSRGRRPKIAT